jgi:RNA recognition motif-containing protein
VEIKFVDWDIYRHEAQNTARIVIFNLAQSITGEQLFQKFKEFGKIISVQVIDDNTNFNRPCFAFIEFTTDVCAKNAVAAMAGKKIENCTVGVDFSTEFFDRHNRIVAVKFTEDWRYTNATDKFRLLSVPLNTKLFGPVLFSHYDPVEQAGLIIFNFTDSAVKFMAHLRHLPLPLDSFHP